MSTNEKPTVTEQRNFLHAHQAKEVEIPGCLISTLVSKGGVEHARRDFDRKLEAFVAAVAFIQAERGAVEMNTLAESIRLAIGVEKHGIELARRLRLYADDIEQAVFELKDRYDPNDTDEWQFALHFGPSFI